MTREDLLHVDECAVWNMSDDVLDVLRKGLGCVYWLLYSLKENVRVSVVAQTHLEQVLRRHFNACCRTAQSCTVNSCLFSQAVYVLSSCHSYLQGTGRSQAGDQPVRGGDVALRYHGKLPAKEYLVQWKGYDTSQMTWVARAPLLAGVPALLHVYEVSPTTACG